MLQCRHRLDEKKYHLNGAEAAFETVDLGLHGLCVSQLLDNILSVGALSLHSGGQQLCNSWPEGLELLSRLAELSIDAVELLFPGLLLCSMDILQVQSSSEHKGMCAWQAASLTLLETSRNQ